MKCSLVTHHLIRVRAYLQIIDQLGDERQHVPACSMKGHTKLMDRWHWPSVAAPIPLPSAGGPQTLKNSRWFLFKDAILILPLPQPRGPTPSVGRG